MYLWALRGRIIETEDLDCHTKLEMLILVALTLVTFLMSIEKWLHKIYLFLLLCFNINILFPLLIKMLFSHSHYNLSLHLGQKYFTLYIS